MPQLVFLHGLESDPHGSKFHTLNALGLGEVLAPNCQHVNAPEERLRIIEAALLGKTELVLVGSSFGGLMALKFAAAHPHQVAGMVLCAPAVHRTEARLLPPAMNLRIPVRVLQGEDDATVPLTSVAHYCADNRLPLTVVKDGHRLQESHEILARLVREVCDEVGA
jgi:pimeloyl-ACP methyl ester carboxylesterase